MKQRNTVHRLLAGLLVAAVAANCPAWAVSLATTSPAQPMPANDLTSAAPITIETWTSESAAAGSARLVPLMAADAQAMKVSTPDSPADAGADAVGKPVDDLAFVKQATESARKEISAARDALPKLQNPDLKRVAEMLVNDHSEANARLTKIAESKGWPLPAPQSPAPPAAGTASSNFDARWTADMIAGHERSVSLYRAQARNGEDQELRGYAHDTLPTIERHLAELKSLQK